MLKALLFDFDGLILDTETPEFHTWQSIYRQHGHELDVTTWGQIVGGSGAAAFDPIAALESRLGRTLERPALQAHFSTQSLSIIHAQPPLPGVLPLLNLARQKKLKLAVASSSPHTWVDAHLQRLGLFEYFQVVICREDVLPGKTKPHPDLFQAALSALDVSPAEAIVFEDSPNGVLAAHRAGIFVVAVPNPVTAQLPFGYENLRLATLSDFSLEMFPG